MTVCEFCGRERATEQLRPFHAKMMQRRWPDLRVCIDEADCDAHNEVMQRHHPKAKP